MANTTAALDRIDIRLGEDDKGILQLAASYEGMALSAFIRKAALDVARSVVERNKRFTLSREEAKRIMTALDRPFEPNAALTKAMRAAEIIEANSQKS
ncbi:MAG: DUF1778 domain-containing protein [Sutterella sp.]|nr:DUF1778 domain-containing protein [Sutterella sp.]